MGRKLLYEVYKAEKQTSKKKKQWVPGKTFRNARSRMWQEGVRKELEILAKTVLSVYSNYMEALGLQNWSRISFCKIFSTFHFLAFAKCCKNIFFFSFLYLYLYYLHPKEQRQHKNTNLIEEQHVNYFQPCQESLELKAGASSAPSFDESFFLASAFLLCS